MPLNVCQIGRFFQCLSFCLFRISLIFNFRREKANSICFIPDRAYHQTFRKVKIGFISFSENCALLGRNTKTKTIAGHRKNKSKKGLPLTFHIPNFYFHFGPVRTFLQSLDSWKLFSSFFRPTFASASFEIGLKPICSVMSFILLPSFIFTWTPKVEPIFSSSAWNPRISFLPTKIPIEMHFDVVYEMFLVCKYMAMEFELVKSYLSSTLFFFCTTSYVSKILMKKKGLLLT